MKNVYIALSGLILTVVMPGLATAQDKPEGQAETRAPVPQVNKAKAVDELNTAYQKEYAFLEAQLQDLRQRKAKFEAESSQAEARKKARIDREEAQLITMQSKTESLQSALSDAELELEKVDDARSTLEATYLQAKSTLEGYGIEELKSDEFLSKPEGERITILFQQALPLLRRVSTVNESPGTFFLADGTEVKGDIIRVGRIAAYGISDQGSGALVPAGENRMKIWSTPSAETAEALAAGQTPSDLGIFIYEDETKAIEEKTGKTLLGTINSGGTIAWVIVALGVVAGVLILLRLLFLRRSSTATGKIVKTVGKSVRKGRLDEALEKCKKFKGATSRVVAAAVRNLDRDRSHLEDIVSEAILHESSHLNRFGAMILVVAAVAPLLGLLGTVTGMISTFDIITDFGTGDPKLLSGGISIALVTTEVGLAVAIPTLLLGNILSGWADSIKNDMERGALRVINQYQEHRQTG